MSAKKTVAERKESPRGVATDEKDVNKDALLLLVELGGGGRGNYTFAAVN